MNARDFPLVKDGNVIYRNLAGYSFGSLHVLSRVIRETETPGQNLYWWRCQCVCGEIHYADTEPLITGHCQSCGCLAKDEGMCEPEPLTMTQRLDRYTFPSASQCAYPHGRPFDKGFKWCFAPVKPESSYCPEHHAVCYIDETRTKTSGSMASADLTQSRPATRGARSGKGASASFPSTDAEAA